MSTPVAVMTLWTKPSRWRCEGAEQLWSLSVLRLRRLVDAGHFSALVLSTDRKGKEWAEALELPFTDATPLLEGAPEAAGKLMTYAITDVPFVHIDGDVLPKRPLPSHLLAANFLVERAERWCPCGPDLDGWDLPGRWKAAADRCARLSWSFGLFGGQAYGEIGKAARLALQVLDANRKTLRKARDGSWATVMVEQWGMARELDPWRVAALLPLGDIANEAAGPDYRHLVDRMKNDPAWHRKVERSLLDEWPEQRAPRWPKLSPLRKPSLTGRSRFAPGPHRALPA